MRKIALVFVLLPLAMHAQNRLYTIDTGALLVDNYLHTMNCDALPADSMLYLETTITTTGSTDTFTMKRWFIPQLMNRVEVWNGNVLKTGLCSNGKDRFRTFMPDRGFWIDIPIDKFYENMEAYDFRGPLYNWRAQNAILTYNGKVAISEGKDTLESVRVEAPGHYERFYMFDPSGMLALIIETNNIDTALYHTYDAARIEWKVIHEYMPVHNSYLMRLESFMRQGRLTVLETKATLLPRKEIIFNSDK